jgi:cell division protein FtsB
MRVRRPSRVSLGDPDHRAWHHHGVKQGISITGRAAVLAVVLVIIALTLAVPVRNWFAQRAEIASLEADLEATQANVAELLIQKERWEDPAFIAAEARRRLHFVLPGETGYVTIGSETVVTEDGSAGVGEQSGTWFERIHAALVEIDGATEPE